MSRTREVGVAVVGFGWMGQVHTRAWARLLQHYPDAPLRARFVAVADPDAGRREQAMQAYGFEAAVADHTELLERDDIDVVSVCGPNFAHRDIGVAVAESGRHLWIEKPAGRNATDTAQIAAAVHAAGVASAVGFNYRHAPAVQLARRLVADGRLGTVESVEVQMLADYSAHPDGLLSWRFDPELAGTGVLGDLASHGFDLALHVGGDAVGAVAELVADQATFIPERPVATGAVSHFARGGEGPRGAVGNEDFASALLRFRSGAKGRLVASRVAVGEQCSYGVEVRGTHGALAWDFRRMGELRLCLDQDHQDATWRTHLVRPGDGELAAFQPGAGIAMSYDDLKVVECRLLGGEHPHRRAARPDDRRRGRGRRAGGGHGEVLRGETMGEPMSEPASEGATGPVRVGVIGVGAMGAAHVDNLSRWTPGAVVSRVYDLDGDRAAHIAAGIGALPSPSAEGVIADDEVDAVLVAAPDPLHEELALACLGAGKPTLLEKPLATSPDGSRRVVDAEVAGGRRLLQLGFMRRFDPAYLELREAVTDGSIGLPRVAHCLHRNAHSHPSHTSEGLLVNSMIHEFDSVPWMLDDPIAAVTVFPARVPPGDLQDVQVAVIETAGGVVVTVEVSINAQYGYDIHTEVAGTRGTVSLMSPYGVSVRREGLDGRVVKADGTARFADAYRIEVGAWVEGIRSGRPAGPSAWDGYLANRAAFCAVESLHGAGRVVVPAEERPVLYA